MRSSTLLLIAIAVLGALMALASPWLAMVYVAAAVPIPVILRFSPIRDPRMAGFLTMAGFAVFAVMFIRPPVLAHFPEFFKFFRLGVPEPSDMVNALISSGVLSALFLLAMQTGLRPWRLGTRSRSNRDAVLDVRLFDQPQFRAFVAALSMLFVVLVFFAGFLNKSSGGTQYLRLLLPFDLLIPVSLILIWYLPGQSLARLFWIGIVLALCAATVFRGSKSALFLIVMYTLGLMMYSRGNRPIPLRRVLLIAFVVCVPLPLSVQVANTFRFGYDLWLPRIYFSSDLIAPANLYMLNLITQRLNGFDGVIVMQAFGERIDDSVFSWFNALSFAAGKLLPGVGAGSESMGVQIGRSVNLVDADADYGGSLGLLGASMLLNGAWMTYFFVPLIGLLLGRAARLIFILKPGPEQALVFILLVHQTALWMISGNFDILISNLVILLIHVCVYTLLLGSIRRTPSVTVRPQRV